MFTLAAGSIAACSSAPDAAAPADTSAPECVEGTPGCIGWVTCPPEFEKDPALGCREIVPASECAAGTMALLGSRECVPVGTTACATGFEPDPSGWGCRARVPAQACSGTTRDAIGSAGCIPVGDCSAAFPPPGALVVDRAFADAELGPKKYRTIGAALSAAKAGETVAIADGEYAEGILARSNVTVVGRCPASVRLVGTGLGMRGVLADGAKNVVVKGVTLVDHHEGARAMNGGTLTLEDTVIEAPRLAGLVAWQTGSSIRAERVVVRRVKPDALRPEPALSVNADEGGTVELIDSAVTGSWEAAVVATNAGSGTPSVLTVTRSVIRDTNLDEHSQTGAAVVISGASRGEVRESVLLDSRRIGALTVFEAAELTITRSEIRRTLDDANEEISAGVYAEGGTIALDDVSLHDVLQAGLLARNKAKLVAKNTVVQGTKPGADGFFGVGAWADTGAKIVLENTALADNAYYGVTALDPASSATLKNVLVRGTASQRVAARGLGRGVNVEDGARAELDGVSIMANEGEGLFLRGETEQGKRARVTAKRLLIRGARTFYSSGVFVAKGAVVDIDGAAIQSAQRSGIIVNETVGGRGSRSEATLSHVVVRDTQRDGSKSSDPDATALDGIGIGSAGKLTLRASAIVDNVQFGIVIGSPNALTTIENSQIGTTKTNPDGSFGHGLVAFTGSNLVIRNTEVASNNVGLVFHGASAILAGSRVRNNSIGIHVQQDSVLATGVEAPEAPQSGVVFVTEDSQFVGNASRVGGGELPLPTDPFATKSGNGK